MAEHEREERGEGRLGAQPFISVIICTYNRAAHCRMALESLALQDAPAGAFEVILVDNNSTDSTPELAKEFEGRFHRFAYVTESRQGLSYARNRGLAAAGGAYVLYLDDDAKAPANWVSQALRTIEAKAPDAIGGPYFAFYPEPKPAWFRDAYASRDHGQKARPLGHGEYLFGGNMGYRRSVLEQLGGFDAGYGMKADAVVFGEENELQARLRHRMPDALIYYDPEFFVHHAVKARLTSPAGALKTFIAYGRASARLRPPGRMHERMMRSRALYAAFNAGLLGYGAVDLLLRMIWHAIFRRRSVYPSYWNWVYEQARPRIQGLGGRYERTALALSARRFQQFREMCDREKA